MVLSLRAPAQRDNRWRQPPPVHRHAVADCSAFFMRVTNVVQLFIPVLDVRAIRRFPAIGNGNVTILRKSDKGSFARKQNWRSPIR